MSASNRLPSFLATMVWEGGARLSLNRSDPGNWTGNRVGAGRLLGTKWGIAAGSHPNLKIAALTAAEACEIFVGQYWNPIRGDELPPGFDHCVSDDSYNAGPRAAAAHLRKVDLLRLTTTSAKIHAYSKNRLAFLFALKTRKIFGAGWARRVAGVEAESLRMAYKSQSEPQAPAPPSFASGAAAESAPRYPTPLDVPKHRPNQPITPDAVAMEAASAQDSKVAAQRTTASGAAGAGVTLPAAGHVHWAIWAICGAIALAAIAFSLWRWRAYGARAAALKDLASELRGTTNVRS